MCRVSGCWGSGGGGGGGGEGGGGGVWGDGVDLLLKVLFCGTLDLGDNAATHIPHKAAGQRFMSRY